MSESFHACPTCGWMHGDIDALIASLPACAECGDPEDGACYRLRDDVWSSIAKPDEVLHPWCAEVRLGRPLVPADLPSLHGNPMLAWALVVADRLRGALAVSAPPLFLLAELLERDALTYRHTPDRVLRFERPFYYTPARVEIIRNEALRYASLGYVAWWWTPDARLPAAPPGEPTHSPASPGETP